jgi:hypothetical protein
MSLDLDGKSGRAHNDTTIDGNPGGGFSAVNLATFDSGDNANAGHFTLIFKGTAPVDLTAGGADAIPVVWPDPVSGAANMLEDGMTLTVVKKNPDPAVVQFTDPVLGITVAYLNRQGESMTFEYDSSLGGGAERWLFVA